MSVVRTASTARSWSRTQATTSVAGPVGATLLVDGAPATVESCGGSAAAGARSGSTARSSVVPVSLCPSRSSAPGSRQLLRLPARRARRARGRRASARPGCRGAPGRRERQRGARRRHARPVDRGRDPRDRPRGGAHRRRRRFFPRPQRPVRGQGYPGSPCASTSSRRYRTPSPGSRSRNPSRRCSAASSSCGSSTTETRPRFAPGRWTTTRTAVGVGWCSASTSSTPHSRARTATRDPRGSSRSRRRDGSSTSSSSRSSTPSPSSRCSPRDSRASTTGSSAASAPTPSRSALRPLRRRAAGDGAPRRDRARLPGALTEGSGEHESFSAELHGGLEYPHFTRPADVSRLGGAGDPALGRPREDRRAGAGSRAGCGPSDERHRRARDATGRRRLDRRAARRRPPSLAASAPHDRNYARAGRPRASPTSSPRTVGPRPAPSPAPRPRRHSRNPVDRLTRGLPDPIRVVVDWLVTIVGAVAIVLLVKAAVASPYVIPSSSMEPTLHCAQPAYCCEARFYDRVIANRFVTG